MFSETRYALNGDLRVAYRASREGPRDIVFVPNWFTNCELFPEPPSIQGWVEAITSLGRLIFFDQPGTGASDPVTPGALPTLEQWADSITAVLDDMGSSEAVLVAIDGALATAALFAATHPSRTTALVALEGPRRHDNSCGIHPPALGAPPVWPVGAASQYGTPLRHSGNVVPVLSANRCGISPIWGTASSSPTPAIRRTYTDSPPWDGGCPDRKTSAQKPKHQFVRSIKYQMSVTTVASGMLNRAIGWLRAGYPPNAPQHGHIALLALYSADPSAARVLRLHAARAGADDLLRA